MTTVKELKTDLEKLQQILGDLENTLIKTVETQQLLIEQCKLLKLNIEGTGKKAKEVDDKQWKQINEIRKELRNEPLTPISPNMRYRDLREEDYQRRGY